MVLENNVSKKIKEWTSPPYDTNTISEIQSLVENNDTGELKDRFFRNLEFGTGGLRGIIGAGTNRMNHYTVGLATQGLANYILKNKKSGSVVIARDSRRMSPEFSRRTAEILAGNGITVYYFEDIMPTPLCSYAIRKLKASAGVVITASHNPPEYNGYKVYWDDGGQIVPPRDKEIITEVSLVTNIETIQEVPFDKAVTEGTIEIIKDTITKEYLADLKGFTNLPEGRESLKIVYTPIHGSGYSIIPQLFKNFGFSGIETVSAQVTPDGDFPTVESPNPEEPAAMAMALDNGRSINADLVLATDPDADRMGVAVKNGKGEFILLNGNQIGTLLEVYMLQRLRDADKLPSDGRILKTIVTTDLQQRVAESFNCRIDEVLTGFKWIADRMKSYDEEGNGTFIFGGEESYGYLGVPFVRDKDAVSSCYFIAEMAGWLAAQGKTVYDFLNEIYREHGLFIDSLKSLTLKGIEGVEKIGEIMNFFRQTPPVDINDRKIEIIKDYSSLILKKTGAGSEEAIDNLPASNVLQYDLEGGARITMRPSGTEPKIKFYFSLNKDNPGNDIEREQNELKRQLTELETALLELVDSI